MSNSDFRLLAVFVLGAMVILALTALSICKANKHATAVVQAFISALAIIVAFLVAGSK